MPESILEMTEEELLETVRAEAAIAPETLVERARNAKENAYQPYSEYSVGAALVTPDGTVFEGVNIENITFDMCSHAERTAMRTAIAEGYQSFDVMAISTEAEDGAPPCGTCRQFLAEFCPDEFIILSDDGGEIAAYTLGELFPHAFRPERVEEVVNGEESDEAEAAAD